MLGAPAPLWATPAGGKDGSCSLLPSLLVLGAALLPGCVPWAGQGRGRHLLLLVFLRGTGCCPHRGTQGCAGISLEGFELSHSCPHCGTQGCAGTEESELSGSCPNRGTQGCVGTGTLGHPCMELSSPCPAHILALRTLPKTLPGAPPFPGGLSPPQGAPAGRVLPSGDARGGGTRSPPARPSLCSHPLAGPAACPRGPDGRRDYWNLIFR